MAMWKLSLWPILLHNITCGSNCVPRGLGNIILGFDRMRKWQIYLLFNVDSYCILTECNFQMTSLWHRAVKTTHRSFFSSALCFTPSFLPWIPAWRLQLLPENIKFIFNLISKLWWKLCSISQKGRGENILEISAHTSGHPEKPVGL